MEKSAAQWMLEPLHKYATFSGRASRSELWWFMVFCVLISLLVGGVDIGIFGLRWLSSGNVTGPLGVLVSLALLIPGLAVAVRRLHDLDKSGWWYLLGIIPLIGGLILLYWFIQPGTIGANRFGADPTTVP